VNISFKKTETILKTFFFSQRFSNGISPRVLQFTTRPRLFHDLRNKKTRVYEINTWMCLRNRDNAPWDRNEFLSHLYCIYINDRSFILHYYIASLTDVLLPYWFSYSRKSVFLIIPFDILFLRDPSINCYPDATFLISCDLGTLTQTFSHDNRSIKL